MLRFSFFISHRSGLIKNIELRCPDFVESLAGKARRLNEDGNLPAAGRLGLIGCEDDRMFFV
jgi:hypothetical protein